MDFVKMQTLGNDYIVINCLDFNKNDFLDLKAKVKNLSDRYFGIGASGVIFIMHSNVTDFKMLMFNQDGTESKMCSGGIICCSKYLYENKIISKDELEIETKAGVKKIKLKIKENEVESIIIDMGMPNISAHAIPVISDKSIFINEEITILDKTFKTTCISMGNPHAVCFVKNVDLIDLKKIGPCFEIYYRFPEKANVEFVEIIDDKTIRMRIWERGVGEVLSCGSAACASVVASVLNHYVNKTEEITVLSNGGEQKVKYLKQGNIILEGNAEFVFEGKKYRL